MTLNIPKITDEKLEELYNHIRPLVKAHGVLCWIDRPSCLRTMSFVWSPSILNEADGLIELCTINTLHEYGFYGMFKPSVAEVLAQVPACIADEAIAFYTEGPNTGHDLSKHREELNQGFHVAQTTFCKK